MPLTVKQTYDILDSMGEFIGSDSSPSLQKRESLHEIHDFFPVRVKISNHARQVVGYEYSAVLTVSLTVFNRSIGELYGRDAEEFLSRAINN